MKQRMPALVNFAKEPLSVELRELPIPEIGEEDVLLQVQAVSICGSDLHQWKGDISWTVNYPCVLGHEFGGTVCQSGRRVRRFREGDRVVSETAAVIDAASPMTRRGWYHLDPGRLGFGYGVDGAMTRFVRVPERCLHRIPDGLDFVQAALTEPCSVAYNAVCFQGRISPGDRVVVLGPGPIGLLCALMARLSGAGRLWVAGLPQDARRLRVAEQLGARTVVGAAALLDEVRNFSDGLGADVVVDATGASASLQLALQAVRPAGEIIKVGWGPQPLGYNLDPLVQKAVTLRGSFSHHWPIWERVIEMLSSGQIDLLPFISRQAPLEGWEECFEKMHSGEYVKAVLLPAG